MVPTGASATALRSALRHVHILCAVFAALFGFSGVGCSGEYRAIANEKASSTCVDTINALRASASLGPLARWTGADACVADEAASDAAADKFHGAFGKCGEMAQNECPAWPGPAEDTIKNCLADMWNEGPGADYSAHGHFINMSSTEYSEVACGFAIDNDGSMWAAQDFR